MDQINDNDIKYNCEKCEYKCKHESEWLKHCATEKHQTGFRKKRSDYKEPFKCDKCEYKTKNNVTLKQHILNEHSSKEERAIGFKFYCKYCDFGTFSKDFLDKHNNTNKHQNLIEIISKLNK